MEQKIIKRYISQKVNGHNSDFTFLYLGCEVEYTDGSREFIVEIHPAARILDAPPLPAKNANN